MSDHVKDYALSQKILHWLMAILVIVNWAVGQRFGDDMDAAARASLRVDHASVGAFIAVLLAIRLYLRLKHRPPGFPDDMALWERLLAHSAHWALYGVMALLVVTGLLTAMRADSVISIFGFVTLGDGSAGTQIFLQIRSFHEIATKALAALVGLHLLAVFYHASVVGNGFITRMFSFAGDTDK